MYRRVSTLLALLLTQCRSLCQVAEPEPVDYPFAASDIAQLQRLDGDAATPPLDAPTWDGLLLDAYFERITGQVSIFGKQVLHQRLADGLDEAPRAALTERLRTLMGDAALLEQACRACRSLRHADTEIAALLFETPLQPAPRWAGLMWLLFVGVVASVCAVTLTPLAWLGAGYCVYQLLSIQIGYAERAAQWGRSMNSVQMMLRASTLLGSLKHPLLADFAGPAQRAAKLNRSLSRSPLVDLIPGLRGYLDWFLLANVKHYFDGIGIVALHRQFLCECFRRCASLEADIALAQHLGGARTCWAQRSDADSIVIEQAVHPLLERPAPLSIALHGKGAFISGQNGIGKSTLLRTVGLNLVVARAFGFCYAGKANVPMLPVYASMQSEDSLLGGESLYIAELQRARELLAAAEGAQRGTCIIDEIFRGTNHLESVSAAAAVLDVLAENSTVIVSSHNLVLASLLEHRLLPFCVAQEEGGALTLAPGLLAHTNGIALLAQRGFGERVEASAAKVFDWLGAYLAQPRSGSHVLGAPDRARRQA